MKYQCKDSYCGPASMNAAAKALGVPVGQGRFAKLAGTDIIHETDEIGVKRGLLAAGFIPEVHTGNIGIPARNWLVVKLRLGYPVILCSGRARWQHWLCAVGMLGNKFIVFDPARFEYRVNTGIQFYTWQNLNRVWKAAKTVRGDDGAYYGVAVLRGEV